MRRALTLLAALTLGAAPLGAGATTVPTLTLTQQARKADVIVRATLGTSTSVKEGDLTWLVYPLTVTETVAGDPASLPQREGKPVLYLLSGVEGLPELQAGQEAFLLLYNRRLDSPIVGFWQGVYPIVNGKVTRPTSSLAPAPTPPVTAAPPAQTAAGTGTTGAATSGTANPGTTSPAASGTATGSAGSTPGTTPPASGTTPPNPGTGTPAAPSSPTTTPPTPDTATPATTPTPGATTTPAPSDPNAIETDPTRFRDALRAAREAR